MKRILIIGDSCMDRYTYCDVKRLSPEKPVPVLEVDHIEEMPGMAMNVYKNMCNMMPRWCVDIVTNDDWESTVKTVWWMRRVTICSVVWILLNP